MNNIELMREPHCFDSASSSKPPRIPVLFRRHTFAVSLITSFGWLTKVVSRANQSGLHIMPGENFLMTRPDVELGE